jgi:hypothetical protein
LKGRRNKKNHRIGEQDSCLFANNKNNKNNGGMALLRNKNTRFVAKGGNTNVKSNAMKSHNGQSRMPSARSIVFWSLYVVVQCYLLLMYHEAAIAQYGSENNSNSNSNRNRNSNRNSNSNSSNNDDSGGNSMHGFELPLQGIQKKLGGNRTKKRSTSQEKPDGTFNGYPIYKLNNKQQQKNSDNNNNNNENNENNNNNNDDLMEELYSQFHCVGETWHDADYHRRSKTHHEQSWMYRSCRFQVLCFDTSTQDYVVYLDPEKHQSSLKDHHYHDDPSNTNPHPSPHIEKILEKQRKQLATERKEVANENHKRNITTRFKHPTFFDDTSTIYRNHTVVVSGKGEVVLGDTEQGKQYGVAIGSINAKWGLVDIQLLKWFPEVRWGPVPGSKRTSKSKNQSSSGASSDHDDSELYDVYTLPPSVLMIPFHSLSAENPGHLVWDDFLPMFTLLEMFGFLKNKNTTTTDNDNDDDSDTNDWIDLLPIRYELPGIQRGLWAGCDWLDSKKESCHNMLAKFGTLMGTRRSYQKYYKEENDNNDNGDNGDTTPSDTSASKLPRIAITTNKNVQLNLAKEGDYPADMTQQEAPTRTTNHQRRRLGQSSEGQQQNDNVNDNDNEKSSSKPKLICAKNALAGFGAISDHLPSMGHGWSPQDYLTTYNSGRGRQLWEFRNYMIHNLFASLPKKKTPPKMATSTSTATTNEERRRLTSKGAIKSVTLGKKQLTTYPPSSITDMDPDEPLVVLFSAYSSQRRGGSMEPEAEALRERIKEAGGSYSALYGKEAAPGEIGAGVKIVVETHIFAEYTLEAQIHMASRTAVFVTYCGGGAITASFLPRGGAVQIYYSETGSIENNIRTSKPARLDWDFFNNCGYLHVNWIPRDASIGILRWPKNHTDGGGYPTQARANIDLILAQLRRIHTERVKHYQRQNNN